MKSGYGNYFADYAHDHDEREALAVGELAPFIEPPSGWGKEDVRLVLDGYDAQTGVALVQNAGKPNRRAYDLVFSPPPDVKVLMLADEEERAAVWRCITDAAAETFSRVLEPKMRARVGKENRLEPVAALGLMFRHETARATERDRMPCPAPHVHLVVPNLGRCGDGKTRAVDPRSFVGAKLEAGAAFRCELARLLEERLGLQVTAEERQGLRTWRSFRLEGIPQTLVHAMSERRKQIEGRYETQKQSIKLARETRAPKDRIPVRTVLEHWRRIAEKEHSFSPRDVASLFGRTKAPNTSERERLLGDAIGAGLARARKARDGTFRETEFRAWVYQEGQGRGLALRELKQAGTLSLKHSARQLSSGRFQTEQGARDERNLKNAAGKLSLRRAGFSLATRARTVVRNRLVLSGTERDAFAAIASGRALMAFDGKATPSLLRAIDEAARLDGLKVRSVTPTKRDAKRLEAGSGVRTISLRGLALWSAKVRPLARLRENLKPRSFLRSLEWRPAPRVRNRRQAGPFQKNTLLVLDEAHRMSQKELSWILSEAARAGARVAVFCEPDENRALSLLRTNVTFHRTAEPTSAEVTLAAAASTSNHDHEKSL